MTFKTVAVVDYGMGNLRSVQNALEYVGGRSVIVANHNELAKYDKIILPGVGAFGQAIESLRRLGLAEALDERKNAGAQILGICLGMQLMCSASEEDGEYLGLGWFAARVVPFVPHVGYPVPHMGWNGVDFLQEDSVLAGMESGGDAYFVHSYHVRCDDQKDVLATTEYGVNFHSMIRRANLRGIQFHPEKSQGFGLTILRNFVELSC